MASPSTAITRFDLSLTYSEFSVVANQRKFIGLKVLPAVGVARQSSDFLRVKVESVLGKVGPTLRAPNAPYTMGTFEFDKDSYATEDHGVASPLDDRTVAMYGSEIRLERIRAMRSINLVLQRFEQDVADAVFDTATWTGDLTTAIASGEKWGPDNAANATPKKHIDAAIESVKASSGMEPNALILSDFAFIQLIRAAQIEDLVKYSGLDDPKRIGANAISALFQLPKVFIGRGFKNTADDGQTHSFSRFWDTTMAMVAHVNDSQDLEDPDPTIGRTIMFTEENATIPGSNDETINVIVEEYRDEPIRGTVLRARNDRQVKILHPEAGHLLTGVTA